MSTVSPECESQSPLPTKDDRHWQSSWASMESCLAGHSLRLSAEPAASLTCPVRCRWPLPKCANAASSGLACRGSVLWWALARLTWHQGAVQSQRGVTQLVPETMAPSVLTRAHFPHLLTLVSWL